MKKIILIFIMCLILTGCLDGEPGNDENTLLLPDPPKLIIYNDTKFDLELSYYQDGEVEVLATVPAGGELEVEDDVQEVTILKGSF